MNVALIGPTCSGKTTCASRLYGRYGLRHLSTGQVLRENRDQQTALGILTRKYMEAGELVPDEIINAMIEEAVRKAPAGQGLLLDGFPSTLYQALFLNDLFLSTRRRLDAVILLDIPAPVVFNRAAKRLPHRTDDRPETLQNRLQVFRRTTGPVINFYRQGHRLCYLDANVPIEAEAAAISQLLDQIQGGTLRTILNATENQLVDKLLTEPTHAEVTALQPSLDIVFMGAPGSGKGTHATFLAEHLKLPRIATGELFRENLKADTVLGRIAHNYLDRGELVPDDITEAMIRERLGRPDAREGFILDGFPRTLPQAQSLDDIMLDLNRKLDSAIYLVMSDEEIVNRIAGRLLCPVCQAAYHIRDKKPKVDNLCDHDGTPLIRREDDDPATVQARLKSFHAQTMPVIQYYHKAGLLKEVPSSGPVLEVKEAVKTIVKNTPRR